MSACLSLKPGKENNIESGSVYLVRLTEKHSINTQGKEYRDKFVIIVGADEDFYFGVFLINTKLGFPVTEQYELKCSKYKYLDHNSFVNCSQIKRIDKKTVISGKRKGKLISDDFDLIIECARNSRTISMNEKKIYGIF
jgi:hypothetical protein